MGQTFGRFNTERPREQKIFDTFENIGPTDYEFNSDHPFGSSEGDYGFGMDPYDEPRARNFNLLGDQFENPFGSSDDDYGFSMDSPFGSNFGQGNLGKIGEQAAQPLTPTSRLTNQKQFDDLYHPESAASNRFNDLISQFPQRKGPSLGRTIVASGMSLTNPEGGQKFLETPHLRDLADWKAQIEPAQKAADLERTTNVNERQYAYQTRQAELAEGRNEIARDRAEVYRLAQMKNQYTFDTKGEYIIAMNKDTGVATPTQIKTSNLSDMDKAMLTRETQLQVQESRNQGALDVKRAEPGYNPSESPNQRKIARAGVAEKYLNSIEYGSFVKKDATGGGFTLVKPAERSGFFNDMLGRTGQPVPGTPTNAQYRRMYIDIYGEEPPTSHYDTDEPTPRPTTPQFGNTTPTRPNGPVSEGPDPDEGLPRTPMTPGLIPEGTIQIKNGKKRVMGKNGAWIYE